MAKISYNKKWIKEVGPEKALKHFNESLPGVDHKPVIDEVHPPKAKKVAPAIEEAKD